MPLLALLLGLSLPPTDTVRLVVVATTDLQGQVTDWDYLRNAPAAGGLARAATVIDSLRTRYPDQVVVVDGGGALSGNPLAAYYGREAERDPHPIVEAMNIVGYDAATPGDRDFDFGADRFNRSIASSSFHWVSGNLMVLPQDTLAFAPFVVLQRRGVKVAIAGFTTPGAMIWNGPRMRGRFRLTQIESAAERVLRPMREQADVAIVLANTGLDGTSSYDTAGVGGENVAAALAAGSARPDLVVVGHSRQEVLDSVIGGVHFVQPRPEGATLAVVHLILVSRNGRFAPVRVTAQRLPLQDVPPAVRLLRRLAEPHNAVLRWAATPVAESRGRFSLAAARVEGTTLMRFYHDALQRATGADLSAMPALDLRATIEPGQISMGEVFRLYPYEYGLRSVRISGADLTAYLEQCARYFYVDSTGRVFTNRYVPGDQYDVVGGASYVIDLSKPMGSRVTHLAVHGRTVQPADSFTLALPDNRPLGQGRFAMLARAPVVFDKGVTVRGALLTELARRKVLLGDDGASRDWRLSPSYLARRARALFVRAEVPEAVTDSAPAAEPTLPVALTRAEQKERDSLERAQEQAAATAAAVLATLRLPAEAGPGGALRRLLADAYRNDRRADVAVVLGAEATERLPARGLTAAEIQAAAMGDATLLTIQMPGKDLAELLENAVARAAPCCEFSGIRVEYDPQAKPWDRVKRTRLASTGKPIDRTRMYHVALSTRLLQGDGFSLGSTDCQPVTGCRTPGTLSRWTVERSSRRPGEALQDYLRSLSQPITPPDDRRLLPTR
jgi:2',3'-cyclic-nucleotide 2'-phosphodiesterase/3'-nucleotidase